jgi:Tat protein secretion system quality control protein TatD with DNase activity
MTQNALKRSKKGGIPDAKRMAEEDAKAAKKGKGYTPIGGGSGGGGILGTGLGRRLFGGGGIFGGDSKKDDEEDKAKPDADSENTMAVKIDPDSENAISIKLDSDGDTKAKKEKGKGYGKEDDELTLRIKIDKGKGNEVKVSVVQDKKADQREKVKGFYHSGAELGGHIGKRPHAPIATGLGDEAERGRIAEEARKKALIEAEKQRKKREKADWGEDVFSKGKSKGEGEGKGITVLLNRAGDEDAHKDYKGSGGYNSEGDGGGGEGRDDGSITDYSVGIAKTGESPGTVELNDINIDHILDAVLEDEDLANQLLDQIDDDELRDLAVDYLTDDEEGDEEEKAVQKKRKKSKVLREYVKSLKSQAVRNYTTEQIFKELKTSISIYTEHPNVETKPSYLNPVLPDALFIPSSAEGLYNMGKRAPEFYDVKSKGKERTAPVVHVELSRQDNIQKYEDLLNENSLLMCCVAFDGKSVGKYDREKLTAAIEDIPGVVAIGPVNLDMHFSPHTIEKQQEILKDHLEVAEEYQLPLFISSEKADKELIEVIRGVETPKVPIVFASPITSEETLKLCLDFDMYVLLRSEITLESYKETYLKYVGEIPRERWLLASGSELILPEIEKEKAISSKNPLIPDVAPEKNKEGKTLVTSDTIFINKRDSQDQDVPDNWNKPELIRDTLQFVVRHFHTKKHPFYQELTENFMHLMQGDALKELRERLKIATEEEKKKELGIDDTPKKKVTVIKAE